ncbi:glycoside hydrolase family 13 protein [Bacillus cereus]|uniref:glycoside hydrolase family 13 protein n=1 Tax=Bacillus cereus TaxID=1396 RepID=UPI000B4B0F78|nr:alpha-glucosidase [Bacillus cereus]
MKRQWWKESVIYQIYPRSFNDSNGDGIGDIKGITEKLDYLKLLGIDVIWLSPVFRSPNDDNGYDISDYKDIMTEFGTMKDFDEMLKKAHTNGIKIMMDLVVNHSSDEHSWFVECRKSLDNKYRDYYIWRKGSENGGPPNRWGSAFGGSAWKLDKETNEYYLHLFSEKQPDLNWENPNLQQEIFDMMKYWLNKGVDGFRMDVVNFISKDQRFPEGKGTGEYTDGSPYFMNGPRIHEYLNKMNKEVLSNYDTITVGEMPGVNIEEAKKYTGEHRNELNMVFHFEHVNLGDGKYGKWTPEAWRLTDLKKIFTEWQKGLESEGWNSLYWSNHDQPRAISRWANDSEEYRVISGKMIATCLHMLQGTPYIYQGEEIGMTNVSFSNIKDYRDIETLNAYEDLVTNNKLSKKEMMAGIHKRSRDNARTPMQWTNEQNAGFTTGEPWINVNPNYKEINVEHNLEDKDSLFYYYQKLIKIRKEHPIVTYGIYTPLMEESNQIFAYERQLNNEKLLVICNFTENECEFISNRRISYKSKKLLISNYTDIAGNEIDNIILKPYETRVYKLNI